MNIELEQAEDRSGAVTLSIKGEIDMSTSSKVRELLTKLFKQNKKAIVIDLGGVPYMDSSGIATLVEGLQWSHSSNNKFRLVNLNPAVKDVFEIARLLTVFEVYESTEEALEGV